MTKTSFSPRVFSGIKPSGGLTLGNYLGAIKRFVSMQGQMETIYCVVDMHAITVAKSPLAIWRRVLIPASRSYSTKAKSLPMPNWAGFLIAWRVSVG
jgi:hypothetical protein